MQLSIFNSQLSMNYQFPFINAAAWKTVNGKYLVYDKRLMLNASEGGQG